MLLTFIIQTTIKALFTLNHLKNVWNFLIKIDTTDFENFENLRFF